MDSVHHSLHDSSKEYIDPYAYLDPKSRDLYVCAMRALQSANIPFLVGGAYAFEQYSGIARHTKDFDIFVKKDDSLRVLDELAKSCGCIVDLTFPHWLYKAILGENFIDVIFSSGNGVAIVDDEWFEYAVEGIVLGVKCKLIPAEEMIWSKAFIMERERFDGADVAHVFHSWANKMDWNRLLRRFDTSWRVLFSHIVLFGYIYPRHTQAIPDWVVKSMVDRLLNEQHIVPAKADDVKMCQGTLLSRQQYLKDVSEWGYEDARIHPASNITTNMSERDVAHWTAAAIGGCARR